MYSIIEKINDNVYLSTINIPGFIKSGMRELVPADYRTSPGIDLIACKPAAEYCSSGEIARVANARSLKRQIEWLCGRIALKELLQSVKYPELGFKDIVITYDSSGKPCVSGHEDTGISVSHSGDLAMAALHIVPGKKLGIDVERTGGTDPGAVMSVAFTPEERLKYRDRPLEEIIAVFTLKEAYLKLAGRGFHEVITKVSVKENKISFDGIAVEGIQTEVRNYSSGYKLSVIYEE
jgi:4'-phosphopantetheinyl transferase